MQIYRSVYGHYNGNRLQQTTLINYQNSINGFPLMLSVNIVLLTIVKRHLLHNDLKNKEDLKSDLLLAVVIPNTYLWNKNAIRPI